MVRPVGVVSRLDRTMREFFALYALLVLFALFIGAGLIGTLLG